MNMKVLLLIIALLMMIFVNVIFGFLMLVLVALFVEDWEYELQRPSDFNKPDLCSVWVDFRRSFRAGDLIC